MAVTVDKTSLGSVIEDPALGDIVLTTTQAVAANGFIVLTVGWYTFGGSVASVAGGGLTWAVDRQGNGSIDTNNGVAVCSAQAPSGLAVSTALTVTFSGGGIPAVAIVSGSSFTGVATSSPLDTSAGPTSSGTSAWTTGSISIAAGSMLHASSFGSNFGTLGSTTTGPSTELVDVSTGDVGITSGYRVESSASSYTVAGTWAATGNSCTVAAAYLAAGGAATPVMARPFNPIPFL